MLLSLVQWVITNVGRPLVSAGVIGIAIMMLIMRANLALIAMVAVGGLALSQYSAIAGMIGG